MILLMNVILCVCVMMIMIIMIINIILKWSILLMINEMILW